MTQGEGSLTQAKERWSSRDTNSVDTLIDLRLAPEL